jgi:hypothetical protein
MKTPNQIVMLEAVLRATKEGILTWHKLDAREYLGKGPIKVTIREITPLLAGETDTCGVQAFQVEINNLIITCWDGSPGCEVIRHILAAGLAEWSEHLELTDKRIEEVVKMLFK